MQLIWYNSIDRKYEQGNPKEFKSLKSNTTNINAYTVLMEFSITDQSLALKIMNELNIANREKLYFSL